MSKIKKKIIKLFKNLKIKRGDNILVYTKLSSFGIIDKNLHKKFINILINHIGPKGTIAMPSYTFEGKNFIFNVNKIKSNYATSIVIKEFFKKKVVRSKRLIHSHIFLGKKQNIFKKNIDPSISLGDKSDFDLMTKNNFKCVYIGCSIKEGGTFLIHLEYLNNVPYRKKILIKKKFEEHKKIKTINVKYFKRSRNLKYDLDKAFRKIIKIGAPVNKSKLRFGMCYSIKMNDFLYYGNQLFKKNVNVLIEND